MRIAIWKLSSPWVKTALYHLLRMIIILNRWHIQEKSEHHHSDRHDPTEDNTYPQIFLGENIYWQHLDLNLQPQDYESDALPLHQEEITESLHTLKDWKHCISRFTLYLILVKIHCILKCWHWASSSCISHISCIVSYWGWSSSFKFWHWLVLLWDVLREEGWKPASRIC